MNIKAFFLTLICAPCVAMEQENKWATYDKFSHYEVSLEYLKKFNFSSDTITTVLEIGCTTGGVSAALARQYPNKQFIAIDQEQVAIENGSKKYSQLKNLKLICASAQNYNLEKNNGVLADIIFCYRTLHCIKKEDIQTAFNNIAAHLKEGGVVSICAPAQEKEKIIEDVFTRLTPKEIEAFATNAGLLIRMLWVTIKDPREYILDAYKPITITKK